MRVGLLHRLIRLLLVRLLLVRLLNRLLNRLLLNRLLNGLMLHRLLNGLLLNRLFNGLLLNRLLNGLMLHRLLNRLLLNGLLNGLLLNRLLNGLLLNRLLNGLLLNRLLNWLLLNRLHWHKQCGQLRHLTCRHPLLHPEIRTPNPCVGGQILSTQLVDSERTQPFVIVVDVVEVHNFIRLVIINILYLSPLARMEINLAQYRQAYPHKHNAPSGSQDRHHAGGCSPHCRGPASCPRCWCYRGCQCPKTESSGA